MYDERDEELAAYFENKCFELKKTRMLRYAKCSRCV